MLYRDGVVREAGAHGPYTALHHTMHIEFDETALQRSQARVAADVMSDIIRGRA